MKAGIAGLGWVTPLGSELDAVFTALREGAVAETTSLRNPESGRELPTRPVPARLIEHLARNPRLRRSSNISYFAVAAAQAALADAGLAADSRTALVFAVSNGGVIYTRRFYEQVVRQGANAASPLLFPETVYNAPASHLAAVLGIDGAAYTLVGDHSIGLAALHFGAQLLALGECDRVLVVGCEELDWIVCQAFHDWRLDREPLSEGAGAVLLAREGPLTITTTTGVPFLRRADAEAALRAAIGGASAEVTIGSQSGQLGDAPGASALWQVIYAALALRRGDVRSALVPVPGFNQQAAAALIALD
ncbi:MAG: beta-ketoacyl synthase N-terminal-like domain-containing protein [Chthoniobacteraceae bacterium]